MSTVKDQMVPISECAKIPGDLSILDAISMLNAFRLRFQSREYRPRLVLVYDMDFQIIGTLRHFELLDSLMPKSNAETPDEPWHGFFDGLFEKAQSIKVSDIMRKPTEAEYVDENTPVEKGAYRLLKGPYLNLFVRSGSKVVGIFRLSDVFSLVCQELKRAGLR